MSLPTDYYGEKITPEEIFGTLRLRIYDLKQSGTLGNKPSPISDSFVTSAIAEIKNYVFHFPNQKTLPIIKAIIDDITVLLKEEFILSSVDEYEKFPDF